jgi:hypothetical protein
LRIEYILNKQKGLFMLTKEAIQENSILSILSDEMITAITVMSSNDENTTIANKTREIHTQYDRDIAAITGQDKPPNVKTYQHLKSVLADFKGKADANTGQQFEAQIQTLTAEKTNLLEQIKKGGGNDIAVQTLTQKLSDKESEFQQFRTTFETERTELTNNLKAEKGKILGLQVNQSIDSFLLEKGVKFKDSIPEGIRSQFMQNAKAQILATNTPEFTDENGTQKIVFRDASGEILWNKETGEQFTAGELYLSKITDLVDNGKVQAGTGMKDTGQKGGATLNLSSAKSKNEAAQMITKYLMESEGLAKTDDSFSKRQVELYQAADLKHLPIQ